MCPECLSLDPQFPQESQAEQHVLFAQVLGCWGIRARHIPDAHWPACLATQFSERPGSKTSIENDRQGHSALTSDLHTRVHLHAYYPQQFYTLCFTVHTLTSILQRLFLSLSELLKNLSYTSSQALKSRVVNLSWGFKSLKIGG